MTRYPPPLPLTKVRGPDRPWMHVALAWGLALWAAPSGASAQTDRDRGVEIEDRIDLVEVDRRILAIRSEGGGIVEEPLRARERVVASRSRGLIGVAATNLRLLGITSRSGSWQEVNLRITETPGETAIHVGDRLALVKLPRRLLALTRGSGIWSETEFQPGEVPVRILVEDSVGVCLTGRRAIAVSESGGGFVEVRLTPREEIEQISLEAGSATLRTPYRVLVFRDGSHRWTELRRRGFDRAPGG